MNRNAAEQVQVGTPEEHTGTCYAHAGQVRRP